MKKRREIVVSSLCPNPMMDNPPPTGDRAVAQMIDFWRDRLAAVLPDRPDVINVYEACDRYPCVSTMEERIAYYECRGERIREFFAGVARENRCYIAYSACRAAGDGTYRNRTELIGRDGECAGAYNKNHLVPDETMLGLMRAGKEAPVIETDFGRVALAICFDLNFTELLDRYIPQRPDLILFSSMYHGGLMQNIWACRCQSYFVGAICGDEGTVINPLGEKVACSTNYFKHVTAKINLDYQVLHLDGNWEKLAAAKRKYGREVEVFEPGHLGCVLLSSHHPERTSDAIVAEFGMELWRDYYARSLKHRFTPGIIEN